MRSLIDRLHHRTPQVQPDPLGDEIRAKLREVQESVASFGRMLDDHQARCPQCREHVPPPR